ncbi:MAG: hypothetical protein IT242_03080 [Bacteroidia bacterium]|nr:hypothetical protein [Bacteroidia bacterium]
MKKNIYLLTMALVAFMLSTSAQSFKVGSNVITAGIGLGSSLAGSGTASPGIAVQYEHGTWDIGGPGTISLGGYIGYKSYKYDYNYGYFGSYYAAKEKWSYVIVGVRSAYHFNGLSNEKFDPYGGLMLSYDIVSYSYSDNYTGSTYYNNSGSYASGVGISLYLGGRYYFSQNFGAMLELGYGVSYITLGAAYSF